jgi:hypothetical protein
MATSLNTVFAADAHLAEGKFLSEEPRENKGKALVIMIIIIIISVSILLLLRTQSGSGFL